MMLQKWNYKTHKYEPFNSPAVVVLLHTENMTTKVDCTNCGKHMTFGDGYTSRTIHNQFGLGYPVCETCYEDEFKQEKES